MADKNKNEELLDLVGRLLYADHLATLAEISPDITAVMPTWESMTEAQREGNRGTARMVIRALGLTVEWGAQMDTHVDRIYESRAGKGFAKVLVDEINEDRPDYDAKLVRRVVGKWEEV